MASIQARRLAAYIVDFEECDGITAMLPLLVKDCASSIDAENTLANFFDEIMEGEIL
jgi:hypothetical protein